MAKSWILKPPKKPSTWVDPTGELPPFLQRRLSNPRTSEEDAKRGKFRYEHPYVSYLKKLVSWARNEHNAEFHWAADNHKMKIVHQLRRYGPEYILAMHPDFASMVELMTSDMWNMFDRRMRDHLTAAYKVAQKIGIVRSSIGVEKALEMLEDLVPEAKQSRKNVVQSLIDHFFRPQVRRRR